MNALPQSESRTFFGVIGRDVSQSKSPAVHNAGFAALELPYTFIAVSTDSPEAVVAEARAKGWGGLAVTMPYKEIALRLADVTMTVDRELGAINTLVFQGILGVNTDVSGIFAALDERNVTLTNKAVVVIGAGGAARAAVGAAVRSRAKNVAILARRRDRAEHFREQFAYAGIPMSACGIDDPEAPGIVMSGECVFQTTPVGGGEWIDQTPVPAQWMGPRVVLLDVVYQPLPTPLMKAAEAAGGTAIGGDRMFLHQACDQFRLWTNKEPPFDVMERAFYEEGRK